jgi:hypothetical protein
MPKRRRQISRRTQLLLFGVLIVVYAGFYAADKYVENPWARSSGGRPTLTGHWLGQVRFGPGEPNTVALHLRYSFRPHECGYGTCSSIVGELPVRSPDGTQTVPGRPR